MNELPRGTDTENLIGEPQTAEEAAVELVTTIEEKQTEYRLEKRPKRGSRRYADQEEGIFDRLDTRIIWVTMFFEGAEPSRLIRYAENHLIQPTAKELARNLAMIEDLNKDPVIRTAVRQTGFRKSELDIFRVAGRELKRKAKIATQQPAQQTPL